MPGSGLDPVVARTMEVALELSNTSMLHAFDEERWMSLFTVLTEKGYTWHADDIAYWLDKNWPHPSDEDVMGDRDAASIYAWAEMAPNQHKARDWAAFTIEECETELGR